MRSTPSSTAVPITAREMPVTPAFFSRVATSSHGRFAPAAQSSRTGSRLPPWPDRNGSGKDPTTAGIRTAAPRSWRSHQMRSPADTRRSCRRVLGLDAVDVIEPVEAPAALACARDVADLLHAVVRAGRDVEVVPEHAHHRLAGGGIAEVDAPERSPAEVARDGDVDLGRRLGARGQAAARKDRGDHQDREKANHGGSHRSRCYLRPGRMTVNLTRIYTRLGDDGETHLGDMSRVPKTHPRIEAYGTVDELNAQIGVALTLPDLPARHAEFLRRIQNDLFDVGADISVPHGGDRERLRVVPEQTAWLEEACDEVNATLAPLKSFVLPGGTPAAAHLHVCRTVCRRAERRTIDCGDDVNRECVRYLNRLSDLLFILSRSANGGEEPLWEPGRYRG